MPQGISPARRPGGEVAGLDAYSRWPAGICYGDVEAVARHFVEGQNVVVGPKQLPGFGMLKGHRLFDDAADAKAFSLDAIPTAELVFDHATSVNDYLTYKRTGKRRKI